MKRILLLLLLTSFAWTVSAQEVYEFEFLEDKLDISSLDPGQSYDHFMGERIGKKLALLNQEYTYMEKPTPTNPASFTVVEKPLIYNNIKKIERYYKKGIKKDEITEETAIKEFERIVDIALLVRYQPTEQLESHLKSIKEEQELVALFTNKVQLNYY